MYTKTLFTLLTLTPVRIYAQDFDYPVSLFSQIASLVQKIIPISIALAFALFVWGLIVFITQSGDEKVVEEGKQKMIWGIIALFVIVSIWGIVAVFQGMLEVDSDMGTLQAPDVPSNT